MSYIDGFVLAVPTAKKQAFIDHARFMDPMFIEWGAVRIVETWGDEVPNGKLTDFKMAVKANPEETVCFSWIEWPDKAARDIGMGKMQALMDSGDERFDSKEHPVPFDGARMIFGGFSVVLDLK